MYKNIKLFFLFRFILLFVDLLVFVKEFHLCECLLNAISYTAAALPIAAPINQLVNLFEIFLIENHKSLIFLVTKNPLKCVIDIVRGHC